MYSMDLYIRHGIFFARLTWEVMNHLKRPCVQHLTMDHRTPLNGTQILGFVCFEVGFVCFEVKCSMSTKKHF